MTAVEWYAEQAMKLEIEVLHSKISTGQMLNKLSDVLEQALEMEREQLKKSYEKGKKYKKPLKDLNPIK
jgi:hypothetical protein